MTDAHVRFFDLDSVAVDDALLSDDERERVGRKVTPALKQRQAASFQCVRVTLGEVLGVAPWTLAFERRDGGKPALLGGGLHFNVSHSGGVGMLAWSPGELGVDVEKLIARPTDALAQEVLSAQELGLWHAMPQGDRQAWLTRAWTRKESTLKAVGAGLRIPPRTLELMAGADAGDPPTHAANGWALDLEGRRWRGVDWFDGVPEGYRAAVCVEVQ